MNSFISEIQMFAFSFPPRNWALCNGQLLAINTNQALFSLLGTQFGGNGVTNFALPDLRGRSALHFGQAAGGSNFVIGQSYGEENHALTVNEMPAHNHVMRASNDNADIPDAPGNLVAKATSSPLYSTSQNATMLNALNTAGSNQPHPNMQPYLVVNFCICLSGIFPSRN